MRGTGQALFRLFAVQGAWNYERMLGVGMGYAALPLLQELKAMDPDRYRAAMARAAGFFNCHPYLAGLALGASVRAEYDLVPGPEIVRLRATLGGPLGALGDQLFWAGLLPALSAALLVALAFGAGLWAVAGFIVIWNVVRVTTAVWALRTGLKSGVKVGAAINASWLPRAARRSSQAGAFTVGIALPIVARWLYLSGSLTKPALLAALAALGVLVSFFLRLRLTSVRYGLVLLCLILLWQWATK